MAADVPIREARPDDLTAVLGVLDGGALETDADGIRAAIERGDALVAVPADSATDGTVVGALVLDGHEILAVAVRRRRRGQGIGSALVRAAAGRQDRLVAEFDEDVRPFYEALGFAVEPVSDEDRFRGKLAVGDR